MPNSLETVKLAIGTEERRSLDGLERWLGTTAIAVLRMAAPLADKAIAHAASGAHGFLQVYTVPTPGTRLGFRKRTGRSVPQVLHVCSVSTLERPTMTGGVFSTTQE